MLVVPVYKTERSPGQHVNLGAIPSPVQVWRGGASATFAGASVVVDDVIPEPPQQTAAQGEIRRDLVRDWQERMETIRERAAKGPQFVVPSRLGEDELKEPRETEPKDRNEDEVDTDVQTDTEQALGFAGGAAGNLFAGSSGARKRGSLVHEVLYRCDLSDAASVQRWSSRLCAQRGVPELAAEVEEHARRIVTNDAMRRVHNARTVLRELPVAWFDATSDMYVEGFVDLAFEEDDGWVLVDYKTDIAREKTANLVARYRPQLDAYRQALSAAGVAVKDVALWFSETGELHVV
jgi:ATP-dependent exoDNAse (exonuclease V) beta subunit